MSFLYAGLLLTKCACGSDGSKDALPYFTAGGSLYNVKDLCGVIGSAVMVYHVLISSWLHTARQGGYLYLLEP